MAMLAPLLIGPVSELISSVLKRVLPAEKMSEKDRLAVEAAMTLELNKMDFSALMGQLNINLEEAKNQRVFVSGWRPFIGWVCGNALAYTFIIQPFIAFGVQVFAWSRSPLGTMFPALPVLDTASLLTILGGLLGLGTLRTYEKIKGASGAHQ